jgi:lipid-binding SYLF domain-containing protein
MGGMRRSCIALLLAVSLATFAFAKDEKKVPKEQERLQESGEVLKEILGIPDALPKPLLDRAECVIVLPSTKKFAIGIGGSFGRGAMSCRSGAKFTGAWTAPALYALEGANIGLQLGGQATDFVLLVMNPRGVESVLKSRVKLGGDASAAAGPKGRAAEAATDAFMRTEFLTYSRSRGLFAGISLNGTTLRQDGRANKKVYGRPVSANEIVRLGAVGVPAGAQLMVSMLNQHSPRNLSDPKSLK